MEKDEIKVIELGTTYKLPTWKVVTDKGLEETGKDLEINFVRGDKRSDVTEEEYEAAMKELKGLVSYPGAYSKHIDSNITYAVHLSDSAKEEKRKRCEELDKIVDRYKSPVKRVDGILHEQLLNMMITDLEYKNSLFPSKETSKTIEKLKEALFWQKERVANRTKRGVVGKYEK
jgi:hypothetical protein